MNAKPIFIFSAIAAASMGAMGTAYFVEQRNVVAKVATVNTVKEIAVAKVEPPAVVLPKVKEKIAVVEVPKPVEAPKATEIAKTPEAPKVEVVPKVADAPQVAVAIPAEKQPDPVVPDKLVVVAPAEPLPVVEQPVIAPKVIEPQVVVVPEKVDEPVVVATPVAPPVVPLVENSLPAFDTVRVEATGDAVIAGRADPGSDVTVKWNGKLVGKTTANSDGSFVLVPEKPMKKGIGALTIEMTKNGEIIQSEGSVIVAVKDNAPALVAKIDPIAPTSVLQVPAATDAPVSGEVQLNAVDYDTAGNIVFSGRAEPGSIVRFYVDNALTGEVATTANGLWQFRGDERVSPGQHLLRADAVDAKGKVKSRIELPFLRETAEVVAAAKIVTPVTTINKTPAVPAVEETAIASVDKKRSITIEKSAVELPAIDSVQVEAPKLETPPVKQQVASATNTTTVTAVVAANPTPTETVEPISLAPQKLVIQPGNNLWKLSREIYGKGRMFTVIYEANRDQLRNPNRIYPGQILTAPQQN
jgi:nucleoid-associated protein YgaU